MDWFSRHLNWTYAIILIVALVILGFSAAAILRDLQIVGTLPLIGIILYFLLTLGGSAWVLWKKGQSLWFLAIALVFFIALIVLVLALPNNRSGQREKAKISDADYYQSRESGVS